MGLSKTQSICILLFIDTAFFLIEIIVGRAVHSLALVADALHMFNDILSLLVGLWAVRVAKNGKTSNTYTYGWQRAEILGALVNGVFLVALCVTIVMEAVERFADPPEIKDPFMVLLVGSCGLVSNIVGLLLFHEHGHGHGHSHGHSHDHGHENIDSAAEEGHADTTKQAKMVTNGTQEAQPKQTTSSPPKQKYLAIPGTADDDQTMGTSYKRRTSTRSRRRTSASRFSAEEIPPTPYAIRQSLIQQGNVGVEQIPEETIEEESRTSQGLDGASETSPLLARSSSTNGHAAQPHADHDHSHSHSKEPKKGGHSHGDMNMRGMLLHVLGDALGNIGVILSALLIWKTNFEWRFLADPMISLIITVIILASAIPLCLATSRILLQAVPQDINIAAIKEDIEELDHVSSCHHLHVWQLSDRKFVASLHIKIDFKQDPADFEGVTMSKTSEAAQGGMLMNMRARTLYMSLVKEIHMLLHEYGIDSSTIQPEFCTDRSIFVEQPAETCLLECDASCGDSISGQCCEPTPAPNAATHGTAPSSSATSPTT